MISIKLTDERYSLEAEGDLVVINGSIDTINPHDVLGKFLSQLHDNILEEKLTKIVIDVSKLTFINSPAIKEFAAWLIRASEVVEDEKRRFSE